MRCAAKCPAAVRFPPAYFAPAAGASALGENPTFFDSAAVLAPPRQISPDKPYPEKNAFLRITLAKGKTPRLRLPRLLDWRAPMRRGNLVRCAERQSPKMQKWRYGRCEPPQMSLLRIMRICLPIRPPISLLTLRQHFIWIWSLRDFIFKKRRSPASADELRMLRTHRRGVCMLSGGPRG